jgi:hypothetical protein
MERIILYNLIIQQILIIKIKVDLNIHYYKKILEILFKNLVKDYFYNKALIHLIILIQLQM